MTINKTFIFAAVLAIAGTSGAFAENSEPCHADADKFCKDAQGKDRMACMKQHETELSDACKARISQMKEKAAGNNPCLADGKKLCPGMTPGDGKFMPCLKQHEAELSEACKGKISQMKEKAAGNNPCLADGKKLCPGMTPGDGKFMPCLKQHEAELSEACKAKLAEKHEKKGKPEGEKAPAPPPAGGPATDKN